MKLKEMFQESDGTASFARIACAGVIAASIAWVTFIVIKDTKLPDLGGLAAYVSTQLGALYGMNKISAAVTAVGTTPVPPTPETTEAAVTAVNKV